MRRAGLRLVRRPLARLARVRRGEEGQSLVEYAMILAFIVIGCVAILTQLGQIIIPFYNGLDAVFG